MNNCHENTPEEIRWVISNARWDSFTSWPSCEFLGPPRRKPVSALNPAACASARPRLLTQDAWPPFGTQSTFHTATPNAVDKELNMIQSISGSCDANLSSSPFSRVAAWALAHPVKSLIARCLQGKVDSGQTCRHHAGKRSMRRLHPQTLTFRSFPIRKTCPTPFFQAKTSLNPTVSRLDHTLIFQFFHTDCVVHCPRG